MAAFKNVEEIEAWQKARELNRQIYSISGQGNFSRDYGLRDQIRRASVSIMANIAEGLERGGNKEFSQFLAIAKGSVGEVIAHLYVAYDQGYIARQNFDDLHNESRRISAMLGGLIGYIKKSGMKGPKYK